MKEQKTAIIVNDRGEAFTGWASACSISVSGSESYHSVPQFFKSIRIEVKPNHFRPFGLEDGDFYTLHEPYVFCSEESAKRTMHRIYGYGQLAVVS